MSDASASKAKKRLSWTLGRKKTKEQPYANLDSVEDGSSESISVFNSNLLVVWYCVGYI